MRLPSDELAVTAGLRYVTDDVPGIRRVRRGRGFSYQDPDGTPVDSRTRDWIESLAIPPAWRDVWINPHRDGHILATGHDDADRKQYIYHPAWEEARDEVKFDRMADFGNRLARIRKQVDDDLGRRGSLDRPKVVALAVAVLDRTLVRVGNRRYAADNGSYGLTTLTPEHADVRGRHVVLAFAGKGGADHESAFSDSRLARLISECQDLEGQSLFSYEHEGEVGTVDSSDVNRYLAEAAGDDFSAKDFRTWGASAVVTGALATAREGGLPPRERYLAAVDVAAEILGNTRDVCRSSYVHPIVEESLENGRLSGAWARSRAGRWLTRPEGTLRRLTTGGG